MLQCTNYLIFFEFTANKDGRLLSDVFLDAVGNAVILSTFQHIWIINSEIKKQEGTEGKKLMSTTSTHLRTARVSQVSGHKLNGIGYLNQPS